MGGGSSIGVGGVESTSPVDDSVFLQDGKAIVAAGYCLFS